MSADRMAPERIFQAVRSAFAHGSVSRGARPGPGCRLPAAGGPF